jgi:hypothetical protein
MLNGQLLAKQILISRPDVKYILPQNPKPANHTSNLQDEILKEIASVFYPVDVKKVLIEHANLEIKNLIPEAMEEFHFPDLSLELFQLVLDSSNVNAQLPFYFISDFNLSLLNQEMVLKNAEQKITFNLLNLDTRNSILTVDKLIFTPLTGNSHRLNTTIDLPQLKVVGKDFKKDFYDRTLNLGLVELVQPNVMLELNPLIEKGTWKKLGYDINQLTDGYIKLLAVDKFRIVDAGLTFDNGFGLFDKQLVAHKLNIEIDGFDLPEDSLQANDKIFFSSAIELDIEDFEFKLPDSVHQLRLERFVLNTSEGFIGFNGIHIDTLKTMAGGTFSRGDRVKADIELFNARFVDFNGVYKQEYVDVGDISILNPKVSISNAKGNRSNTVTKIPEFLKNYAVGSLSILGLDLVVEEAMQSRNSLEITQGDILATDIKPLSYAHFEETVTDRLELSFESVFYQPEDGKQIIATDQLLISKKDSSLCIKNFKLYPDNFNLVNFEKGWALLIPDVEVSGFAIDRAMYHKELLVQKVYADQTLFRVVTGKTNNTAPAPTMDLAALKEQLVKTFVKWDIKNIEFDNSSVRAYSGITYDTEIIEIENFTVRLNNLYIDSTVNMARDNILFADDIQFHLNKPLVFNGKQGQLLGLTDFSLSTKDGRMIAREFTMTENQSSINPDVIDKSKAIFGFKEVDVLGIDFYGLIENRKLGIDSVLIEEPVFLLKREYSVHQKKSKSQPEINLYNLISGHLFELRVDDFEVSNATLEISNTKDGEKSSFIVNRVDVDVKNILVDSLNDVFSNKFLYSDDLDLNISDYSYNTANGLYLMGASNISFSSEDALLLIDSGFVTPLLEPAAFAKKVGVQTDRLDFAFVSARLENFRLYDLFYNNNFRADYFYLTGLEGEDYRDKSYERPLNHFPNLPASGLKNLGFGVRLDSARIVKSRFTYRELVKPDTMPGRIWFDDITLKAKNITNDEDLIAKNGIMGFEVQTKLMGEGLINLTALFLMQYEDSIFVSATLGAMDLTKMNPLLEHIAFVKVKKGQNELLDFHFNANNDLSTGDMKFSYNNLAIRLISKESLQPKGFGGGVVSFVANTFVVRSKNPVWGIFPRNGTIYFPRDKTRSFFNYLAKSALSGVSSTIRGGNEKRKEERIKKKAEKKQGKGEGSQ